MRNILVVLLVAVFPFVAFAQSGRVAVRMDDAANTAILSAQGKAKVSGYRVCIFSDNSQTGRAAAQTAVGQLRSIMPGVPSEVSYENPFFKAYAGICLNRIEAARLLGRLRSSFPRAIIVSESFPVSNFAATYQDITAIDSTENEKIVIED